MPAQTADTVTIHNQDTCKFNSISPPPPSPPTGELQYVDVVTEYITESNPACTSTTDAEIAKKFDEGVSNTYMQNKNGVGADAVDCTVITGGRRRLDEPNTITTTIRAAGSGDEAVTNGLELQTLIAGNDDLSTVLGVEAYLSVIFGKPITVSSVGVYLVHVYEDSSGDDDDDGLGVGAIVGIAIGGFIFLVLVAGGIFFIIKRKNEAKVDVAPNY